MVENLEAVSQTCSVKTLFLEISQNSQENTCSRAFILIKLQVSGLSLINVIIVIRQVIEYSIVNKCIK